MKCIAVFRRSFLPLGLILTSLVLGCSTDSTPLASADLTLAADGRAFLSFSPEARQRAGKLAAIPSAEGVVVSELFTAKSGGKLEFEDKGQNGTEDDLGVYFRVARESIDRDVVITMTVYGSTLADLVIAFEPGGLCLS